MIIRYVLARVIYFFSPILKCITTFHIFCVHKPRNSKAEIFGRPRNCDKNIKCEMTQGKSSYENMTWFVK